MVFTMVLALPQEQDCDVVGELQVLTDMWFACVVIIFQPGVATVGGVSGGGAAIMWEFLV